MTNRNTRRGELAFLLIALVVLVVLQPGPAKAQDIEQLRKDAEQGDADAQFSLGVMYDNGEVVSQDYQEAVGWFRMAAEQGNVAAQCNLGLMCANGQGVPQDYQEAVSWYRKAAEQGNADAQYNLGVMYTNGQGVPQDYVQAHKWVNLAASVSTGEVAEKSRILRDKLAEKMTASQIAEAQRLAREWQPNTWEQLKDK